jgi:hypothetical protein
MSKGHLNFSSEVSNLSDILNKINSESSGAAEGEIYRSSTND